MRLVNQKVYPTGRTYSGTAISEVNHIEFLMAYTSYEDAISHIYTGAEEAANQRGYTLLKVDIYYENGILYHIFDMNIHYIEPQQLSELDTGIQQLVIPLPLWPIIYAIVIGLIAYILINSFNKSVNSVFYEPTGGGGWSPFSYAVIFIGAALLLNALTGVSKEVRRY